MPDEQLTPRSDVTNETVLERLASIADSLDAAHARAQALELRDRVADGRFYVACLGEFKRGKSTLLNALVGQPVLPTGIVPVTAVPTVLRYGDEARARVRQRATGWRDIAIDALVQYVSEEHNPENAMGVEAAEVFIASPLLRGGMSLVDTPGIGSVFEGNTTTTQAFVPHIDAAIAVIGADPPISGEELALIARVTSQVPDLIVVLNKADRHSASERAEAVAFTERILIERLGRGDGNGADRPVRVLQVSAVSASRGETSAFDWERLMASLQKLEARSGPALVRSALARGVARLVEELKREIAESHEALTRPMVDSERRVEALRRVSVESAHRAVQLRHLFDAEEEQLFRTLEQHREEFRARIEATVRGRLASAIADARANGMWGPRLRRVVMEAAGDVSREGLEPWLAEEARIAETLYRQVGERFVSLADAFLEELARAGALGDVETQPQALRIEKGFRVRSRFYFSGLMTISAPVAPGTWIVDLVSPTALVERRVIRDGERYLRRLLDVNSAGVTQDLRERVRESRRELEAEVQRVLRGVYETAERALVRARARHSAGVEAVSAELDRLEEIRFQLATLRPAEGESKS